MRKTDDSTQIVDLAIDQRRIVAFLARNAEAASISVGVMKIR